MYVHMLRTHQVYRMEIRNKLIPHFYPNLISQQNIVIGNAPLTVNLKIKAQITHKLAMGFWRRESQYAAKPRTYLPI